MTAVSVSVSTVHGSYYTYMQTSTGHRLKPERRIISSKRRIKKKQFQNKTQKTVENEEEEVAAAERKNQG